MCLGLLFDICGGVGNVFLFVNLGGGGNGASKSDTGFVIAAAAWDGSS